MNRIGNELQSIAEQDLPLSTVITEMAEQQLEIGILFERGYRHGGKGKQSALQHALEEINGKSVNTSEKLHEAEKIAEKGLHQARTQEERREFEGVLGELKGVEKEHDEVEKHIMQCVRPAHCGGGRHGSPDKEDRGSCPGDRRGKHGAGQGDCRKCQGHRAVRPGGAGQQLRGGADGRHQRGIDHPGQSPAGNHDLFSNRGRGPCRIFR